MTEQAGRPDARWVGPASLWASVGGTLIAVVGVSAAVTDALLAPAALLALAPGALGLLLALFRSTRQVGLGLATTLLVPVLTAVALWAGFGLADYLP